MSEMNVRYRVDRSLENKGWVLDSSNPARNVFFESSIPAPFRSNLGTKRPDYTLFGEGKPIGIIETKKPNSDLNDALDQGMEYADRLDAPLIFATNGAFYKTRFLRNQKELYLNGNEVRDLLTEPEATVYVRDESNAVYTFPEQVVKSRDELIQLFAEVNGLLRGEGLLEGLDRFGEFANILFLKLLSEHNDPEYWNQIKNATPDQRIDVLNRLIYPRLKDSYGGDVVNKTQINNPETLSRIIEKLDPLVLSVVDMDIKGSAFEHFLQKTTNTKNDLGQYFTPRHIVRMMVSIADPKLGETVYDPFCGTGGFLTEAYRYIRQSRNLNVDEIERLKTQTLFGRELSKTAVIAKMNMVLYGDGHSGVHKDDSLRNPVDERYDVVLTNIPFSQEITESSMGLYYDGLANKNGDAACLLHCFRSLRPGGRMVVITPEGFLENESVMQTRRFLADNSEICLVAKFPRGCFLPYTPSTTAMIYIRNKELSITRKFWFVDVNNDGFSLDAHRKKIDGDNDLDRLQYAFSGGGGEGL